MEPMTLGSAPSSPSTSSQAAFLPQFLLGETPVNSPTQPITSTPQGKFSTPRISNQSKVMLSSPLTPKGATQGQKKPGPPSQGLFETLAQQQPSPSTSPRNTSQIESPYRTALPNILENSNRSLNHMFQSSFRSAIEPPLEGGGAIASSTAIDSLWVTVFGFPSQALGMVLAQLAQCGAIIDKRVPSCPGNWVHVKFANAMDVQRALSLNGRCLTSLIMIGVSLHRPQHNSSSSNNNKENAADQWEHSLGATSPIRARPLRQTLINTSQGGGVGGANAVVTQTPNVPQKTTGIVSKAMEYVFGW